MLSSNRYHYLNHTMYLILQLGLSFVNSLNIGRDILSKPKVVDNINHKSFFSELIKIKSDVAFEVTPKHGNII